MKLLTAFFRLIRWPNLVFIALTQTLFYTCVIIPSVGEGYFKLAKPFTPLLLIILILASVLIAAAGYIINDYFDINIDQVNKPNKMVVEKIIRRRWAIIWHFILTLAGLVLSTYVAVHTTWLLLPANFVCVLLLWFYSTTFKRKLLTGNIIISLLTAWTVFVLYIAAGGTYFTSGLAYRSNQGDWSHGLTRIFKFAALYGGFAFIISLIREVVKDIEDINGDARYQCNTMPIAWGVPASKVFVAVWLVVLLGALAIVQFYALLLGWWLICVYCILLVIIPLLYLFKQFHQASNQADYHRISNWVKLIMLSGILSMLFFKLYV